MLNVLRQENILPKCFIQCVNDILFFLFKLQSSSDRQLNSSNFMYESSKPKMNINEHIQLSNFSLSALNISLFIMYADYMHVVILSLRILDKYSLKVSLIISFAYLLFKEVLPFYWVFVYVHVIYMVTLIDL